MRIKLVDESVEVKIPEPAPKPEEVIKPDIETVTDKKSNSGTVIAIIVIAVVVVVLLAFMTFRKKENNDAIAE